MDLASTLFCGQTFAWERRPDGAFAGVAGGRAALCSQEAPGAPLLLAGGDGAPFSQEDRAFWRRYFALDVDWETLLLRFCADENLAACVAHARGVRVLRQPFFDTLLTFILSQNNHIPRIHGLVQRLREGFGPLLPGGLYGFPAAERLAALEVEDLACLRAGFRAKYLLDAARRVASGEVSEQGLAALPDDEARAVLMRIHGVGPKVADCVLLYGLGRQDVVPMDVWMKRAVEALFGGKMPPVAAGSAGIAQQYVFCWARDNLPRGS